MPAAVKPPRAWQRMLSGRRLDLLDPSPVDVEIEDIAHGLSRVARWNGQTRGAHPFSVADHSVLVLDIVLALRKTVPRHWQLFALLHDAPEYVVGDLISPFKSAVGLDYKALETRLAEIIHIRFGLPATPPEAALTLIKKADRAAAWLEATQLAGFAAAEADKLFKIPAKLRPMPLDPLPPEGAKQRFLDRFVQLSGLVG